MKMVDTNIVIDLLERDEKWFGWSLDALARAGQEGPVSASVIVIGELALQIEGLADIHALLDGYGVAIAPLNDAAAYAAGMARRAYRLAGGSREKLLADFLIGGHAQSAGATLLTRDPRRYRSYFPSLALITPESHP